MNNEEEEMKAVIAAMDAIEDLSMSMFPKEPEKAVTLIQTAFVRTAVRIYGTDILDTVLESTEEVFRTYTEMI